MAKVILGTTMSLDGFINDQNGEVGGLYPDLVELQKTELLQESMQTTGAVIMGRHAYDMAQGNFTGYEYQVPIFVVTHTAPEKTALGENSQLSFTFVSEGIENAVAQAKASAGDKDVTVVGGADIAQQLLNAGLVDELQIGLVPILLGSGLRFLEHLNVADIILEKVKVLESAGRTDLVFRVIKRD